MKNFDIKQWRFNRVIMENILYESVNEGEKEALLGDPEKYGLKE